MIAERVRLGEWQYSIPHSKEDSDDGHNIEGMVARCYRSPEAGFFLPKARSQPDDV